MPHVPDTIEEMKIVLPDEKEKRIDAVSEFLAKRYGYKPTTMKLYIRKRVFGEYLDVAEILDRMDENDAIIKKRQGFAMAKNLPHKVDSALTLQTDKPSAPKMEISDSQEALYAKADLELVLERVKRLGAEHKGRNMSEQELVELSHKFFDIVKTTDKSSMRFLAMHFLASLYGYAYGTMDSYYSMNILGNYETPKELIENLVEVDKVIAMRKRRRALSASARKAAEPVDKKTQSSDQLLFEIEKRKRQVDSYTKLVESSVRKRDRYQKELDALLTAYDILHGKDKS